MQKDHPLPYSEGDDLRIIEAIKELNVSQKENVLEMIKRQRLESISEISASSYIKANKTKRSNNISSQ